MIISLFITIAIISFIALADDQELFVPFFGDEELYVGTFVADEEIGTWFIADEVSGEGGASGGGGGGGLLSGNDTLVLDGNTSTAYYDIIIKYVQPGYAVGDLVNFSIAIINKGDIPDRDAVLHYYIQDPNKKVYGAGEELFEEVQPTCFNAVYNRYDDKCWINNTYAFQPFTYIIDRTIALPLNATAGEWMVYVEYKTEVQPLVKVYKKFRIDDDLGRSYMPLSAAGLLILTAFILFIMSRKKRRILP